MHWLDSWSEEEKRNKLNSSVSFMSIALLSAEEESKKFVLFLFTIVVTRLIWLYAHPSPSNLAIFFSELERALETEER